MKSFWIAFLILALTPLPSVAQGQSKEKKASDEITISTAVKVGAQMLEPGAYRIACNTNELTFTRLSGNKTVLTAPCKGKDLGDKAANTEVHTSLNKDGVRVVDKLLIRGSNVEHVF